MEMPWVLKCFFIMKFLDIISKEVNEKLREEVCDEVGRKVGLK